MDFDAIVVGSGISGGWAAKELTERGLKTLVLERGPLIEHGTDYTDFVQPWQEPNFGREEEAEAEEHYAIQSRCYAFSTVTKKFWVKDSDHPYITPDDKPFFWLRGYHLGGRSLTWGRQTYRWSPMDFESNKKDGYGVDWPIRYDDLAPWYDHVERFAGISGSREDLPQLPDSEFLPAMDLNCVETELKSKIEAQYPSRRLIRGRCAHLTDPTDEHKALGRGQCQYREFCSRGCSFGAYFSSLSATLPAARNTGNLTIVTDAIAHSVVYDAATGRASGVRVIEANTKEGRTYEAKVIFLCASTFGSAQVLLNSVSEHFPNGIANRSDQVGRNVMDHLSGMGATGEHPGGHEDSYYYGRRPNGFYIPRYANVTEETDEFVRGYGFQGMALRDEWIRGVGEPGVGEELKTRLRKPGPWTVTFWGFGEMLPDPNNRITLHPSRTDKWGMPVPVIDCDFGANDRKLAERCHRDAVDMLEATGFRVTEVFNGLAPLGFGIHEMGTARMGRDPATSVLNGWNQAHDVPNLFVTDGSCMTSSACQNPSLTYMAITARAANHAADLLKESVL